MLGNDVALWDTMLAAFKLGAVVIPATALLNPDDLRDRPERGQVCHLVVGEAHVHKFAGLTDDCSRVCVGSAPAGWVAHNAAFEHSEQFEAEGRTLASGKLVQVLKDWTLRGAFANEIYLIRPYSPQVPKAVSVLVGYLKDKLSSEFRFTR